ncbi:MAG TPA: hypothetical protein VF756_27325 [Thermoanaerobaculia bacterium]
MSTRRVALIALGLLIAASGIFLIVRGFRGAGSAAAIPADPPAAGARGDHGKAKDKDKAPRWQSFVRPGDRKTPSRPLVRFASGVSNPFDRLATRISVSRPGNPNPGFRLEGISVGTQPVALISGRAVREGGTISGFRVVSISRSRVMLAGPRGARLALSLGDGR